MYIFLDIKYMFGIMSIKYSHKLVLTHENESDVCSQWCIIHIRYEIYPGAAIEIFRNIAW